MMMMRSLKKSLLLLLFLLATGVRAHTSPATTSMAYLQSLRGGASIGPVSPDDALAMAKVAATAYLGGSAGKFIASKTGGSTPKVRQLLLLLQCVLFLLLSTQRLTD